ncbi:MAG: ATP-dependent helicase [Betaproteobacteria bacterium]|nr:MAG: ATP-dependent helicase [Betaproteobacteria bacterium]
MHKSSSKPPLAASRFPAALQSARSDYLASLNPEQRIAVECGVGKSNGSEHAPLLIIAGAGSGKTNTLAYRVAHLVCSGADPQRILLLTFSRRAAQDMVRRTGQILSRVLDTQPRGQCAALPWAGTFHSIGARLLREYAERIGLNDTFTIHDRGDSEDLLGMVRHELGLGETKNRFPTKGSCLAVYSRTVNSGAPLSDVLKNTFPRFILWEAELKKLFDTYVGEKQLHNVLDYDDLLLYWSHTVSEPSLGREIGERFDHVLVDEYQDTNRLQASILLGIKPDGKGLTVVGDDAQSIYSFRAATVRNILDFPKQFQPPARVVSLERNYRSTRPILDASNGVIGLAAERHTKNLWTDQSSAEKPKLVTVHDAGDQAEYVAAQVLHYRELGIALKAQAVLFRSSSHSAELELELGRRGIPFVKYGGLKFLEAAHIKDVLAILRWAENPRDRLAGFRAIKLLPGVGSATAVRLLDTMGDAADPVAAMRAFSMPPSVGPGWHSLLGLLGSLRRAESTWPADMDSVTRWYAPHLQRIYEDAHVRQGDLVQLQQIASTYASRERFLTEVTLDPPSATSDEAGVPGQDDDYLILSTIHSAKGQEWKAVQILNVVDGCIPSDMSTGSSEEIEEERRLLYVAMTRAKNHLHLLVPQRFYAHQQSKSGDRHVYAALTRFIPERLLHHFEPCAWPVVKEPANTPAKAAHVFAPTVDISARARALWR